MQRHESYKPSGIKWIGEIPTHWDVRPGFTCFDENKDRNKRLEEKTVLSLSYGRIVVKPEEKMTGLVPESFDSYQLIKLGDIVIRTTDLQNDKTSLRVGLARDCGMITSAYLGLRCKPEINPEFIFRLLASYDALKVFYGMGSGLRQNIDFGDFKRLPIPLPPRAEQDRIVAFLNQKSAEIDAAIKKKERLIESIQEWMRILTNKAVLHGLNLDVITRNSGIAWIENIPAHWQIKRAKFIFRQSRLPVKKNHGVVTAYRDGQVTLRSNRRVDGYTFAILEQGYQGVIPGQLVINSMDAFAGAIGVSDSEGKCSPEYVVCNAINANECNPSYNALLLRQMALSGYIEVICSAVRQRALRIRYNDLAPLLLPVPPISEQLLIVNFVDEIRLHHDGIILKVKKEIQSLKDFARSLIAEVVTGRIKV
jgi:type I restriction enzyme S subunit